MSMAAVRLPIGLAPALVVEHVVAPTLFVFLLLMAMLFVAARTWPWNTRVDTADGAPRPPLSRLARHLLITAVAGYVVFLFIVLFFHVIIGGGGLSIVGDAASGGAFLGFVLAVPVLLGLAAVAGRRSR
jgi:hypothetical protein